MADEDRSRREVWALPAVIGAGVAVAIQAPPQTAGGGHTFVQFGCAQCRGLSAGSESIRRCRP